MGPPARGSPARADPGAASGPGRFAATPRPRSAPGTARTCGRIEEVASRSNLLEGVVHRTNEPGIQGRDATSHDLAVSQDASRVLGDRSYNLDRRRFSS